MQNALEVKDVSVSYGQSEVIRKLNLVTGQGEIVALMGLNGMGKTTLMKALVGILPVKSGSITLNGLDITRSESFERVGLGLAYVPQGRMIFPALTVEENIKAGLKKGKNRVPDDVFEFFPVLKEMYRRRGGNLSGGQQQQLALARALVSEPDVLLLDEPTEGIQPSIIKELARVIVDIRDRKKLTVIVSEQVLSFALAIADRLLVLDRGQLVHESLAADADEASIKKLLSI